MHGGCGHFREVRAAECVSKPLNNFEFFFRNGQERECIADDDTGTYGTGHPVPYSLILLLDRCGSSDQIQMTSCADSNFPAALPAALPAMRRRRKGKNRYRKTAKFCLAAGSSQSKGGRSYFKRRVSEMDMDQLVFENITVVRLASYCPPCSHPCNHLFVLYTAEQE